MREFRYWFLVILSLVLIISGASCEKETTTITVSPPAPITVSTTTQSTSSQSVSYFKEVENLLVPYSTGINNSNTWMALGSSDFDSNNAS